jgi:hypothetical protein
MAITGCGWWECILLAVGIDLGLVVTECAAIVASPAAAKSIRHYVWAMITSTLALSAGLNSWAFAQHSEGLMTYASCAFGFLRAPDGLRPVQGRHRAHVASLTSPPVRRGTGGFLSPRP